MPKFTFQTSLGNQCGTAITLAVFNVAEKKIWRTVIKLIFRNLHSSQRVLNGKHIQLCPRRGDILVFHLAPHLTRKYKTRLILFSKSFSILNWMCKLHGTKFFVTLGFLRKIGLLQQFLKCLSTKKCVFVRKMKIFGRKKLNF
jgi:hypothetical protein